MVASLGNLPGQLAQLFLWSMDNFDKEMSDRYLLVRTSYNCFCLLMFQEEPLMPPAMAARSSPPEGIIANHPVGNTANLPKWLVPGQSLLRKFSDFCR